MEEKKLIEKLRICSKTYHVRCGVTCENKVCGSCRNILMAEAVDLINSKNETIAEYERKLEDGELDIAVYARSFEDGDNITVTCDLLNAMDQAVLAFNRQKAEIERLQDENEKQKTEIERLTEYNENLNGMCLEFIDKNAELQKQVDELKEERKNMQAEIIGLESQKEDLYFQNQNLQTYIDNHETIWKRNTEQAVKDRAKEIFEAIFNDGWAIKDENGRRVFVESRIRYIAKERYGVEV